MKLSKHATKRSSDQIRADRARIADLLFQQYTHEEIAKILHDETGIELSRRQITYDVGKIREEWLARQSSNYAALVNQELDRLDTLEREVWRQLRDSKNDKIRTVVEKLRASGEDKLKDDMIIHKITETIEQANTVDAEFLRMIMSCHQERRKLLGLYTQHSITDIRQTVVVKGYAEVSPNDWDEPIEGEFTDAKRLPAAH